MKKTLLPLSLAAAAALFTGVSAQAQDQFTVGYSFAGTNNGDGSDAPNSGGAGAPEPATAVDPSLTLGDITRASGYTVQNYGSYFVAQGYGIHPNNQVIFTDVAESTTSNQYITFTLAPSQNIALTNLVFGGGNQLNNAPATNFGGLTYSTGAAFTELTASSTTHAGNGGGDAANPFVSTFDLTTLGVLTSGETLTFRLFLLDSANNHGYQDAAYANGYSPVGLDVEIDGMTVPDAPVTPEPGTWAMLVSGAVLLVGAQRLRRQRTA